MAQSPADFFTLEVEQALAALKSSKTGLTETEARQRLLQFGPNELPRKQKNVALEILVSQFTNFLVILLIASALALYFLIGETLDAAVILAIVILNATVGFVQEFKAENAMEALRKMSALKSRVLRNGTILAKNAIELVPGDIVLLEAGDRVPADGRIVESFSLLVDESALTGESTPVEKENRVIPEKCAVADQKNMVFKNTAVVNGKARVVVAQTGARTEIGKIAGMLSEIEEVDTPLVRRLKSASFYIGIFVMAVSVLLVAGGLFEGKEFTQLMLVAIGLAVAAVPEGLPVIITITLGLGAQAMAKKNSVVRKIQAVETVGNCSVICSDKTGTLTKNEMNVTRVWCGETEVLVSGSGFELQGEFRVNNQKITPLKDQGLEQLLWGATLANDAVLDGSERSGDPTEVALLVAAKKAGVDQKELKTAFEFVDEEPFATERKRMSVQFCRNGAYWSMVKGSPEAVLEKTRFAWKKNAARELSSLDKEFLLNKNSEWARSGLRVLGIAFKKSGKKIPKEGMEEDLVFLGLIGMIDSPRPEAKAAIEKCREAGILVKMITGDHPLTALAIGKQLGLASSESDSMTGSELDAVHGEALERAVLDKTIFARVNPAHKLVIVQVLQKHGHVVAMTGDGVNDAPALKQADVGFAMGITGTEVSKEAAEIVLADDNFASIVLGIEEGRKIYSNIRNFLRYLFAANLGEVIIVLMAVLLNWEYLPLVAIQLLWINLATDGLPALAMGAEKGNENAMRQKPRPMREPLLHHMKGFILIAGILSALVTLGAFMWALDAGLGIENARTTAFNVLVFFELVLAFSARSEDKGVFEKPFWDNPKLVAAVLISGVLQVAITQIDFFHAIFETTDLSSLEWGIVLFGALTAVLVPYANRAIQRVLSLFRFKKMLKYPVKA